MTMLDLYIIMAAYLACMIVFGVWLWRKKAGLMALILKLDRDGVMVKPKVKGNRAYLPKGLLAKTKKYLAFEPQDVFIVKVPRFNLKGKIKMILGVEGRFKAIRLENKKGKTLVDSSYFNTKEEWDEYIKAQNARSQAHAKSFSNTQFYVLVMLSVLGLVLLFLMGNRIGVF